MDLENAIGDSAALQTQSYILSLDPSLPPSSSRFQLDCTCPAIPALPQASAFKDRALDVLDDPAMQFYANEPLAVQGNRAIRVSVVVGNRGPSGEKV